MSHQKGQPERLHWKLSNGVWFIFIPQRTLENLKLLCWVSIVCLFYIKCFMFLLLWISAGWAKQCQKHCRTNWNQCFDFTPHYQESRTGAIKETLVTAEHASFRRTQKKVPSHAFGLKGKRNMWLSLSMCVDNLTMRVSLNTVSLVKDKKPSQRWTRTHHGNLGWETHDVAPGVAKDVRQVEDKEEEATTCRG